MEKVAFSEYLEKRYYDQLNWYEKTAAKNKKKYKYFQWLLIIMSTATTIFAALQKCDNPYLHFMVLGSAALVTILSSALKTFQYQELWVSYRTTIEQLKPEIYYYQFNAGEYGREGVDKETLFVARIESILSKEHDAWPIFKKLKSPDGKEDSKEGEVQK